ncbi:hypothetical protein [Nocardioides sp. YIM 152588]|uniref:hypothetical protein n=1 Tax=Nocardioides sp. YIM 152588 TaxID=3158259 RepID=UPI0032E3D11F
MTTYVARGALTVFLTAALASGCGSQGAPESEPERVVDQSGTAALAGAFATAGEATSYRLSTFTAQKLSSSLLGIDTETEIDEDEPALVAEMTPAVSHLAVDVSAMLGPIAGEGTDIGFELWNTPERITVDSRDYAALKEATPSADLGPFEPGVSYLDLEAVADDSSDLVAIVVGQGVPDLHQVADDLPESLDDVEQDDRTITGRGHYADVMAALGQDVEQTARSAAAGLAQNLGVDVDELTELYVDFYGDAPTEVTIELDAEGSLSSIGYTADLSDLYVRVFETPDLFTPRPSAEELEQARDLAGDTVWMLTVLQRYDIDDDLVVSPAPATDDDRTAEWLAFLDNAGF